MAKKEIKKAVKKAAKPAPKKAAKPAPKKAAKPAVKKVVKPAAKKPAAPAKKAKPEKVKPLKKETVKPAKKQTPKPQPKEKVKDTVKAKTQSKAKEKPKEKEIAKSKSTPKGKPAKEEKNKKAAEQDDEDEIGIPEDMMLESADIPEPAEIAAPKLSNKEKQKLKQLQAKALAKVRAAQRAKEHAEMLAAAALSLKPVAKSKSGRVSYTCEYVIKSSPTILFEFVTTPSGLVQWFADRADINGEEITFNWKGSEETAAILEWVEDERVRYRWEWHEDDEFFQFRIYKNEVTMDTVLEVTDFAEEKEVNDQRRLWDSQIKLLMKAIGS